MMPTTAAARMRGTLQARLFRAFVLVTLIAAALPAILARNALYRERLELASRQALAQVSVIRSVLESGAGETQVRALLHAVKSAGARMTLTAPDGTVIHDSHVGETALPELDNHNDRPEIEAARVRGAGVSLRRGSTLGFDAVYAAVPLAEGGVLRLAVPLADIRHSLRKQLATLAVAVGGVVVLCLLLSMLITRGFRRGIDALAEVVAAIARNKGGRRVLEVPGGEFLPLGVAVNTMAEHIEEYVATTTDQHTQLEVILESVHEGIVVLGPRGNVRRCNRAALALFPALAAVSGRQIIEAVPVPALQREVEHTLGDIRENTDETERSPEAEAVQFEHEGRFLVAHISRPVIRNQSLGAVVVLYDASRIMRLERVRRDFVANVSHELRTPLTAISGYAETLMELDELDPVHRNFAAVIHKHSQSLGRVIADLLALARIEDAGQSICLSPLHPVEPLREALRLCAAEAERKRLHFLVDVREGVSVMGNASLLTQVFRNLLENACRYAPEGGEVVVSGTVERNAMLFSVKDHGPGIPREELGRIFERLYQVKKQRNSGSSGIGLAIGKHIVERHGGRIWAESPYRGFSTAMLFTLPLAEESAGGAYGAEPAGPPRKGATPCAASEKSDDT